MTRAAFPSFGAVHLAILAAVVLVAAALAALARRRPAAVRTIRLSLAGAIAVDALGWYGHLYASGSARPPRDLPLELCDVVLAITCYALLSERGWALEVAWFVGIAGSGMALLTPDVGADFPSWAGAQFFVAHGLVVAGILFLALAGRLCPRPGAWWRVLLAVNVYAAVIAVFDARFGTNYLYLREKPRAGTLFDLLGPWPLYVLAAEPVAAVLFLALDLPFRRRRARRGPGCAAGG
jgi:hypothetical integral membrane protein (TIGR02206 family)